MAARAFGLNAFLAKSLHAGECLQRQAFRAQLRIAWILSGGGHVHLKYGGLLSIARPICRRFDYDHYLCCLLLPPGPRTTSIALRSLNVELAHVSSKEGCSFFTDVHIFACSIVQVKDLVSDKTIGKARFQFWRDAIDLAFQVQCYH